MFMHYELIQAFSLAAEEKVRILKSNTMRYLLLSAFAGIFVGFGILLIFTIGGLIGPLPIRRIIMGMAFGIALTLVIVIGSEIFTGNNMIMTVASLEKRVSWKNTRSIWLYSFVGNLIGSIVLGWTFVTSGVATDSIIEFVQQTAAVKMSAPFMELFFRAVLCNVLVCLAIMASFKLKSETAKLIVIWWCLFAFITLGFEHSVANMSLFSIALFSPSAQGVTLMGAAYNLVATTFGNFVGGAGVLGLGYWFIGKK